MRHFLFYLFTSLALSVGLMACGEDSSDPELTCTEQADCADGTQCYRGMCRAPSGASCAYDLECAAYEYCGEGTCQLSVCDADSQCAPGAVCDRGNCRAGCEDKSDCGPQEICSQVSRTCTQAGCTPNSCGRFQVCDDSVSPAACTYDGSCDSDSVCNAYARALDDGQEYVCQDATCVVKPPCESDQNCDPNEICIEVADANNYCRDGCRSDAECGLGKYCNEELRCVTGCTSDNDCIGEGEVCVDLICRLSCSDRDQCTTAGMDGWVCTGSPSHCQLCTDSNQCYGGEYCNTQAEGTPDGQGLCEPNLPTCPDDGFGPNHARENALRITEFPYEKAGEESPIYCKENGAGEWFKLSANPGEVVQAEIKYTTTGANLDLALLDADGNDLMVSARSITDNDDGQEKIIYAINPAIEGPVDLYIQVRGAVSRDTVPYELRVDVGPAPACADDGFEPNNSLEAAAPLPGDNTWHRDLEVCGDDLDFYALDFGAGEIVSITVQAEERFGALDVSLWKDGELLIEAARENDSPNVRKISYAASEDAAYVLKIEPTQRAGRVAYDLAWKAEPNTCLDDLEGEFGNDQCSDATALQTNMSYSSLVVCNDSDYYKVTLLPEDRLLVRAVYDQASSQGTLAMSLFGPNTCGTLLESANTRDLPDSTEVEVIIDDEADSGRGFRAEVGGDYYILVERREGIRVVYSIETQVTAGQQCVDDRYETPGNDSAADAVALDPALVVNNGPHSALLDLKTCDYNEDWFAIDVTAGDTLTWQLVQSDAEPGIGATLIDSDGTTPVLDTQGDPITLDADGKIEVTNESGATKTYYLRVAGADGIPVRKPYRLLTYLNGSGTADPHCPDAFENNDSPAEAHELGTGHYAELLSCEEDDDWYKTRVSAGETITVQVDFEHMKGNIDLALFDDANFSTPRAESRTTKDTESVSYTSARDQYVYYRVDSAYSEWGNSYDLTVAITPADTCDDDKFQGNHASTTAEPVTAPGLYNRLISCEDRDDWFEVSLTRDQLFEAALNFDKQLAELKVEIYAPGDLQQPAATSSAAPEGASATYTPTTDGTHYVRVSSADPNVSVRLGYDLMLFRDLDFDGAFGDGEGPADRLCPDIFENNDTFATASVVSPGLYEDLLICSGPQGIDLDYYNIFVPGGATLTVDVAFLRAQGDLSVTLLGPGRTPTNPSVSSPDMEQVTATNTGLGAMYTLEVRARAYLRNHYSMDVSLSFASTCNDDTFAGNIDQANAAALSAGAYALMLCEGTEDWFEVSLSAGETLTAHAELAQRAGDIDLVLQNAAGDTLAESRTQTNFESIVFTNSTATTQTYYLRAVAKDDAFIRNAYDLWVAIGSDTPLTPYCPDPYERNDTTDSAYILDILTQSRIADAVMCGVEEDWYQIELIRAMNYQFAAFFNHSADTDLALEIRDENGMTVASVDSDDNDEFLAYTPAQRGTYFFGVKQMGTNPAASAPYALVFDRSAAGCVDDSYEPNNRSSDAKALPAGAATHTLASCSGGGPFSQDDYFTITPEQDGTIHIEVLFNNNDLALAGQFGAATMDDSVPNRLRYSGSVSAGTEYKLSVTNPSESASGPYFLRISYED